MKNLKEFHTTTVLEYLVMINQQSYSGIGRKLNITPQQFSDWIKKRRPIPRERLTALLDYFGVDGTIIVDENQFAKQLTPVAKNQLHILLIEQKIAGLELKNAADEDIAPYRKKKQQLERDQKNQILLTRLAALLEMKDERFVAILETVVDKLQAGHVNDIFIKLNEIR